MLPKTLYILYYYNKLCQLQIKINISIFCNMLCLWWICKIACCQLGSHYKRAKNHKMVRAFLFCRALNFSEPTGTTLCFPKPTFCFLDWHSQTHFHFPFPLLTSFLISLSKLSPLAFPSFGAFAKAWRERTRKRLLKSLVTSIFQWFLFHW